VALRAQAPASAGHLGINFGIAAAELAIGGVKAETMRFVSCATRDLLEGSAFDVESWLFRKVSDGMRLAINA
jgi:hypothetical protein